MNRTERRAAAAKSRPKKTKTRRIPITIRFSAKNEFDLQMLPHQMLEGFRDGTATEPDWHALAFRINWGHVLAATHFADGVAATAEAQRALEQVQARHAETGRWGVSQPEFAAMAQALTLTDHMQVQCTRRELDAAWIKVMEGAVP